MGRPTVPADIRSLILRTTDADPRWGAPRIHGDLLKLGIDVSQATVAKYMGRRRQPPSQSWRTFFANHIQQIVAADFLRGPDGHRTSVVRLGHAGSSSAAGRARRRDGASHGSVDCPTGREAFPWDASPRYLLHDRET
jgi:hypothetical protein